MKVLLMPVLRSLQVLPLVGVDWVLLVYEICTPLRGVLLDCMCDIRGERRDIAYGHRGGIQNRIRGRFVSGCRCRLGCVEAWMAGSDGLLVISAL